MATVGDARSASGHQRRSGDYDSRLVTTVSVGFALLAVNVVVLLCVCYHRKVHDECRPSVANEIR